MSDANRASDGTRVSGETPRRRKLRAAAINAVLLVGSLAVFLLLCEFVIFRFILPGSDVPENDFANDLVRYRPNQTGVWRVRNEIAAPYAINAQGWNAGAGDYVLERKPDTTRVAVIGDSFVEAMQVPHDRSVAEVLATELSRDGRSVEAYRFAISGAPLSQYLHMAEREAVRYRPDWIVVVLVHNDFDESLSTIAGRYTSSFLHVRVRDGRVTEEVAPRPWRPGATEWVRRTATARFFYYRWQVHPETIRSLFLPAAHADDARFSANIDVQAVLSRMPDITVATDYLFGRLAAVARSSGARLLLAMDGDRQAVYANRESAPFALNVMAGEMARRHAIPFVDLQSAFAADWRVSHQRFEHVSDNHWNERGHAVAARAIAQAIRGAN